MPHNVTIDLSWHRLVLGVGKMSSMRGNKSLRTVWALKRRNVGHEDKKK